jgi:hypothetical protein
VVCPVANAVGACVLTWVCCVIGMLSVTAVASTRQASGTTMSRKTRMRRQCWLAHTAALSAKRSATVEVCHECLAFWYVEHHGSLSHAQCDVCVMWCDVCDASVPPGGPGGGAGGRLGQAHLDRMLQPPNQPIDQSHCHTA